MPSRCGTAPTFRFRALPQMVDEFLAAAGLDQVVLVANDTGGAVAQYVVADRPARIAALVLTPCDAFDNFVPLPIRHLRLFGRTSWGLWVLAQTLRWRWVQRLPIAFGLLTERAIPADIMRSYTAPCANARAHEAISRRWSAPSIRGIRWSRQSLAGFPPVLLAWARERRRFFPLEHAHRLASLFPTPPSRVIEDSGPFVTEDQPRAVATTIRRFVAIASCPRLARVTLVETDRDLISAPEQRRRRDAEVVSERSRQVCRVAEADRVCSFGPGRPLKHGLHRAPQAQPHHIAAQRYPVSSTNRWLSQLGETFSCARQRLQSHRSIDLGAQQDQGTCDAEHRGHGRPDRIDAAQPSHALQIASASSMVPPSAASVANPAAAWCGGWKGTMHCHRKSVADPRREAYSAPSDSMKSIAT
jgi:pimeloyl-ACP methyl ester carboxylesterase